MKKTKSGSKGKYADTLFDVGFVHQIDIQIAEEDWKDLQNNPANRTKYKVNITIDGETLEGASFSTKGVSSLVFPAITQGNKRYSFKIKFKKKQKYHGLDKLDLNCCFRDATLMKDYFCYRLFRMAGVPAPLASHAWVTVNGKDHGLYLIVEKTEESYLERCFGEGVLYKPATSDMGMSLDEARYMEENGLPDDIELEKAQGADFAYIDDDPASYPDIFNHRKTDGGRKDDEAVIASLKILQRGTDLEKGLDTHEIIRYFAVHNFVLNYDGYTGQELHNMIICEKDGILSVMPWDYNLAFGTYVNAVGKEVLKDLTDLINQGIDEPLIGSVEKDRPLWSWIMREEKYRLEYHEAISDLIEEYFESGMFEREFADLQKMLAPYEETDPNAFYSYEEFKKGCDVLRQVCLRRARSVRKQLNGELSTDGAKQNDRDKVSASDLNVMDMGAYAFLPKE